MNGNYEKFILRDPTRHHATRREKRRGVRSRTGHVIAEKRFRLSIDAVFDVDGRFPRHRSAVDRTSADSTATAG